jgi:hypothetical protein
MARAFGSKAGLFLLAGRDDDFRKGEAMSTAFIFYDCLAIDPISFRGAALFGCQIFLLLLYWKTSADT